MTATHVTVATRRIGSQHRLELIEQNGEIGIFKDLDCPYPGRITCKISAVYPTFEVFKEWARGGSGGYERTVTKAAGCGQFVKTVTSKQENNDGASLPTE